MSRELGVVKKRVKGLIRKGKIEDAIYELEKIVQSSKGASNELILLSSRYSTLKTQERNAILNPDQLSIKKNEVTVNLLEFIDEISDNDILTFLENSEVVSSLRYEIEEKNELILKKDEEIEQLKKYIQGQDSQLEKLIDEFESLKKKTSQLVYFQWRCVTSKDGCLKMAAVTKSLALKRPNSLADVYYLPPLPFPKDS